MNLYLVDAFTGKPFGGNPAGVCVLDEPAEEAWMQRVAMEMNQAETAFLHPEDGGYRLRWFSPVAEVDLCGHATLASAHLLWEQGHVPENRDIRFRTKSGELAASKNGDGWIRLDFPQERVTECEAPAGLAEALGVQPVFVGRNRLDVFAEVGSEEALIGLSPDFGALKRVVTPRGFIVTSRSGGAADFASRCFFPGIGVDEDPVTGSAHCALTPYWADKLGKTSLRAIQRSKRQGELKLTLTADRVWIYGQAVTTLRGEWFSKPNGGSREA
ncbi:PhzF family phenazine biosynthesis protein [Cohnella caldifontis]|uniref:PhzF family phenazine biosynthesis protein n=1 Tax=Cohnella caldifontis TaxID=3027471 RepID=UPI0023ED4D21|nr:PhzF family phenazine biosynthesis protein [Cohnella sp. YIM B05605]